MSFCIATAEAMHAGMAVGNAEDFEHALQGAVFAGAAVQHVERHVGLERAQVRGDVAVDVDAADLIAGALERVGAGLAGAQRDIALGRPAAHQDRDVFQGRNGGSPNWRLGLGLRLS